MKKFLQFCFIVFFASLPLWAQINLISPCEGVWANRQMLVIDNSTGGDFFYSVDGADPETFGFAYDGPVLLDVEGEVKLNLTHIKTDGKKEKSTVKFTVYCDDSQSTGYYDFVQTFFDSGMLNYSAGSKINIPSNLFYSLERCASTGELKGQTLQLSEACVLSRYIPCTVSDRFRNINYRFVIKTYPQNAGIYSKRDVPFEISDWETIIFKDMNQIYKIDSEYWGLPSKPCKIDRSVSHMISWQPLEYDSSNPIEFFVLPPKPEVIRNVNEDGSIVYSVQGDEVYSLSILNGASVSERELFSQIGIDAFEGERVEGALELGVFANSVYQGKVLENYSVDKKPPELPVFKTNVKAFCSRENVNVTIEVPKGAELYVALSEPYTLTDSDISYSQENPVFKNVRLGQFKKMREESYSLKWAQNSVNPVFYKVAAYSMRGENKSQIAEYCVLIDQSNYYFDSESKNQNADGTAERPFTKFEQFSDALITQRVVKLRVKGNLKISEAYTVESNFEILNAGDALLDFGSKGSLNVKASTVEISGCRIHNSVETSSKAKLPLIKLENSVLSIKDCIIGIDFAKSGTVIDSFNSIINISDTIGSVKAVSYASFISAVKSRINVNTSSLNTNADTCVVISADGGSVTAAKNEFMVTGSSGRIAELFGVKAEFRDNTFKSRLSNMHAKVVPLYTNKKTSLIDEKNERQGF